MIRVCRVGVCVALAVAFAGESAGQGTSGTIRGSVRDPQGSAVPSAVVEVVTRGTALTRRATSDADGSFVVPDVPPATVDITVTAPGFGEARRTGVVIEVGQTASLIVELPVQQVRETVVVDGAVGVFIDTSRSVVDAVIPAQLIESLPLNGRNFLELALLVPGNAPAPNFDPTKSNTVTISSAGQLGRGGNVMVDGADNNDDVVGGPLQNVTQEAVQEFQIATNRFTAESGRSASSADQRRDKVRQRSSCAARRRSSCATAAGEDSRQPTIAAPERSRRSIASSSRPPRAVRSCPGRRSGSARRSIAIRTVRSWWDA